MMWKQIIVVLAGFCLVIVESEDGFGVIRDQASPKTHPNDFLLQHNHGPHDPSVHGYRTHQQGFQHHPNFHHSHVNSPRIFQHTAEFHPSQVDLPPDNGPDPHDDTKGNNRGNQGGERGPNHGENALPNSTLTIPLAFLRNISNYSVNDLLLNFVEGGDMEDYDDGKPVFTSRFGDDDGIARSEYPDAAMLPKKAGCIPEFRTLELASTEDPSILYIPQCTRIEQCGGCCSHALLSCQPIETETLAYQVRKTQYTGNKKLKMLGKEIIPVERHIKCKCDCKIKAENCNQYQEYRPDECRCTCKNTDEEQKCYKAGAKKLWNPELCACQCRDVMVCTTGYNFDPIQCKCSAGVRRRYASYDTKGYDSEAVSIVPLDQNDY